MTNYYEVKGKLKDGMCFVLQKNVKTKVSVPPSVKSKLMKEGTTAAEIKKMEVEMQKMSDDMWKEYGGVPVSLCAAKSGKVFSAEMKDWKKGSMSSKSTGGFGDKFSFTQYPRRGVLCAMKQPCGASALSIGLGVCFGENDCYTVKSISSENNSFVLEYGGIESEIGYNSTVEMGTHKFTNVGTQLADDSTNTYWAKLEVDCED